MGKVELISATESLALIAKTDTKDFLSKLIDWNKNKAYPISPISIKFENNHIEHNADEIKAFTDKIEAYVKDVVENDLDLDEVESAKKATLEFHKFLSETRKIQTSGLDEAKKQFTAQEARYKPLIASLKDKIDAINEKQYQTNERAIKEHLQATIDLLDDESITLEMFKDFIEVKRKNKVFTTTGNLTKTTKVQADEAVAKAYAPIQALKELEAKKALQQKQFEGYLENIVATGKTPLLEANVNALIAMEEIVEEHYPDITEHCYRAIRNKIDKCEANIRANEAIAQKEALQNADGVILEQLEAIKKTSSDMLIEKKELEKLHKELQGLWAKCTFVSTKDTIKTLGENISKRIQDMQVEEIVETPTPTPAPQKETEKSFSIDIEDLEVIADMHVSAVSEVEAINKLVQRLRTHLQLVGLKEEK